MIHNDLRLRSNSLESYGDQYQAISTTSPNCLRVDATRNSLLASESYRQSSDDSGNESSIHYQAQSKGNTHFVVVAIDFGTTYSGYAFAFTRDADSILMMRKVDGNDPGVNNQKTPTTILLTPNLEFHSFGFFARDFFHDLDPDEAKRWLYFEKFKMHLHYTQVSQ